MKIIQYIPFVLIVTLLASCNVSKNISEKNILIEFEKTSCSGTCPVFSVKIASTGFVIYEGKENVDMIGVYKSNLSENQLNQLINQFDNTDFFNLKNSYKSFMMDLPTKYITYYKNGQKKRIEAYDNIPDQISNLIGQIDELIEQMEWKKID